MKVFSLVKENNNLKKVEVEITLLHGMPAIHFLGLPDQVIRESIHRIKSALRNQGFEYPKAKQILVNIRPNYLKKSSRGVELAVAAALLWETEQLPRPISDQQYVIYGELGLQGEVFEPADLITEYEAKDGDTVLTGVSEVEAPFQRHFLRQLKDLNAPEVSIPKAQTVEWVRPSWALDMRFTPEQARLIEIMAMGEHSALLAGPAGSGKSTLAKSLSCFLSEPQGNDANTFDRLSWRSVVQPHHTISPQSMVGGGVPPKPGEIARAHRGLLILDELLEFHPKVQEALREPMEEGVVRISRGMQSKTFPCEAMIVATTNLCPCGDYVPGAMLDCRFSRWRCDSYHQKLSGPLLDRFEILFFTSYVGIKSRRAEKEDVSGRQILDKINTSRSRLIKHRKNRVSMAELEKFFDLKTVLSYFPEQMRSHRRRNAALRILKTIADLEGISEVGPQHIEEALSLSFYPFEKLKKWD